MGDLIRNAGIAVMEEASGSAMSKRRKIVGSSRELHLPNGELGNRRFGLDSQVELQEVESCDGDTCLSFCSDPSPASCCSSNESSDVVDGRLRLVDLEAKSFETVDSTSININHKNFSKETTPSSELCGDSEETEFTPASNLRKFPAGKLPPTNEIEEFFAIAEKAEQKRFTQKYNYDILNDMPLEGRYQWVCLKP